MSPRNRVRNFINDLTRRFVHRGGDAVTAGSYWNIYTGEHLRFEEEGLLPGDADQMHLRMSSWMLILLSPVLGLAFAVFFPVIGLLMVGWALLCKGYGAAAHLATRSKTIRWKPGNRHVL